MDTVRYFVAAILIIVPLVASAEGPLRAPWHSHNMDMIDSAGREVVLKGVNVSGMEWGAGTVWGKGGCNNPQWGKRYGCYAPPPQDMYDNLANWGFNAVRLPLAWANIEPKRGGEFNEVYLQAVDHIVHELGKRGIAIILSMHQWAWSPVFNVTKPATGQKVHGNGWPVWLYQDDWLERDPVSGQRRPQRLAYDHKGQMAAAQEFFQNTRCIGNKTIQERLIEVWVMLARRYRGVSNLVGVDLINEPYGDKGKELEDYYLRAAKAIHAVNPDWLLAFEPSLDRPLLLDAGHFLNDPRFPRLKAVYSAHVYSGSWDAKGLNKNGKPRKPAKGKIDHALNQAQHWNVPLWIGEFHLIMDGHTVDHVQSDPMMRYLKKDGTGGNGIADISWTYWAYQRDSQPLGGETGNGPINKDLVQTLQSAK